MKTEARCTALRNEIKDKIKKYVRFGAHCNADWNLREKCLRRCAGGTKAVNAKNENHK